MKIFDPNIREVRSHSTSGILPSLSKISMFEETSTWPRGSPGEIILNSETAIELGHPQTESLAFLMWTDSLDRVRNGITEVIGPELNMLGSGKMPLGKVTILGGHGFTEENAYDRFIEMDMVRTRIALKGYMLRAAPQQNREWSRVSQEAIREGFSLRVLGNELIREYRKLPYVDSVEVLFITSSVEDIRTFKPTGEKVSQIIKVMNKIFDNLELDCDSCDLSDVCGEIEGLRGMHKRAWQQR